MTSYPRILNVTVVSTASSTEERITHLLNNAVLPSNEQDGY